MDNFIHVSHLTKIYKLGDVEVHALRGVTTQVNKGEFVAVMGASGSGKSTFMNILGCLDKPTHGTYTLEGLDVSEMNAEKLAAVRNRKIGFVFQQFNLLSRTSALENVELPLIYDRSVSHKERIERSKEALRIVGLDDRANHFPNQLSGGQQQRVAIARALVNSPSIILADEPTGNLDSHTSVEVMDILQKLNKDNKITIILVTHEKDIAQFAKRNLFFYDGRIKWDKQVEDQLDAVEVINQLPPIIDEEDEQE